MEQDLEDAKEDFFYSLKDITDMKKEHLEDLRTEDFVGLYGFLTDALKQLNRTHVLFQQVELEKRHQALVENMRKRKKQLLDLSPSSTETESENEISSPKRKKL